MRRRSILWKRCGLSSEVDHDFAESAGFNERVCFFEVRRGERLRVEKRADFSSVNKRRYFAEDFSMMGVAIACKQRHESEDPGVGRAAE